MKRQRGKQAVAVVAAAPMVAGQVVLGTGCEEAKEQLGELAKIDPDAIRRATTFFPFATGSQGKKSANDSSDDQKEKK